MFEDLKDENNSFKNFINGKWIPSSNKKYIEIYSPIDDTFLGRVPAMSKEEVDLTIISAKEAQKNWSLTTMNERAKILNNVADKMEEYREELINRIIIDVAKDRKSAESEVTRTIDFIRFTVDAAKGMAGESIPGDSFPGYTGEKFILVKREPLGVVLAISPFNYPINLSVSKIAPALIAGNSVVLKAATQSAISALYLVEIFRLAGLPKGVLNTVTGQGSEIGDYLVTHKYIDFINFTGSTKVGNNISKITSMKPLLMELGGKDAAIVLESADLELAASHIVSGAYSYSGQRCTAVKRVIVQEAVADKLVKLLKEKIEKLVIGNPLKNQVDIVPLIDDKAVEFVKGIMVDAEEKGAKVIVGGKIEGRIVYPTLYDKVNSHMRIAWEEPFGPILPVIRVKDKEEAIDIANKSEYGLQSSVFTNNINDAFYIANKLEVGTVQINNKTERGPDHFPFMGVKNSGMGTQGIKYSIKAMSREKGIVINIKK